MELIKLPFKDKCPVCGISGNLWHKKPEVFRCPKCASIYSEFGMIIESYQEDITLWN